MKLQKICDRIAECATLFGFEYNGKECHVDPAFTPTDGYSYLLFCDGEEQTVRTLDEVMRLPFFDGACLNDIAEHITIAEW